MKYKLLIFVIIASLFITSCTQEKKETIDNVIKQELNLKTIDNTIISAAIYPENSTKAVILVHMYGEDQKSWQTIIPYLRKEKNTILTIDLRGHGNSEGRLNELKEQDFINMSLDIKAAYEYLKSQEIYEISIIGASIGANAAINFAAEEKSLKSLILLSPGIEYRGIKTERAIRKYYGPLLILVGKNDKYSYDSSERLFKISPSSSKLESYETSNHGTELILKTAGVKELIKDWLGNN